MTKRRHGVTSHATKPPEAAQDDQTRSAILVAARGLIQRYGFRKTTMDDIARAVGKERTSLYYSFPGKKEVMKALIEHEFAEISQAVREEVAHQGDAAGRLRTYVRARLDQVVQRSAIYSHILPEMRSGGDGVPDIFQMNEHRGDFDKGEERFLVETICQGSRDGQFRAMAEAKITLLVRFIFFSMRGLELDLFMNPDQSVDLRSRLDVAIDVFVKGLQR